MIITIAHMRSVRYFSARPGYCIAGARAWFERHQLDWKTFCRQGLPEELLLATNDAFAIALVQHARQESVNGK